MLCRAPSSATTCAGGSPTGAQLAYDTEGQLTRWQNAPTSPTSTDDFLYDGDGNRVQQQSTSGGTTTTTTYLGDLEEVTSVTSGTTTTTTTTVYYPGGLVEGINGDSPTYLISGGLGSPTLSLAGGGSPNGSVLYDPYGNVRYSTGSMVTDLGFTGQHSDASTTGLDYYNARYYDPTIGQFASADTTLLGGLNRYAYVGGNPTTFTDPSGDAPQTCDGCGFNPEGVGIVADPVETDPQPTSPNPTSPNPAGPAGPEVPGGSGTFTGLPGVEWPSLVSNAGQSLLEAATIYAIQEILRLDEEDQSCALTMTCFKVYPRTTGTPPTAPTGKPATPVASAGSGTGGGGGTPSGSGQGNPGSPTGVSNVDPADPGAFTITDWTGYPTNGNVPQPAGPFKILEGQEYQDALKAGKRGRDRFATEDDEAAHHIHPIKFGGAPEDQANLIAVGQPWPHQEYTNWWKGLQREIEAGNFARIQFLNP